MPKMNYHKAIEQTSACQSHHKLLSISNQRILTNQLGEAPLLLSLIMHEWYVSWPKALHKSAQLRNPITRCNCKRAIKCSHTLCKTYSICGTKDAIIAPHVGATKVPSIKHGEFCAHDNAGKVETIAPSILMSPQHACIGPPSSKPTFLISMWCSFCDNCIHE